MSVRGVQLKTDDDIRDELRFRTRLESPRVIASQMGISTSHLYGILNGNARLGDDARTRILEAIRSEELDLADKIEAEMHRQ